MDPSQSVPEEKVAQIVEAVRMAPTSSGLQPFELFVIRSRELREAIREAAFNQAQITDGSHLLVFAAWDDYTDARIDALAQQMSEERGASDKLQAYYDNLKAQYVPRDAEVNYAHAARQAYIALGFALAAAAELEVDSTPMEGFVPAKVDALLGLKERGLRSVVLLPLGVRHAAGDGLLPMPKVRRSKEDMVVEID